MSRFSQLVLTFLGLCAFWAWMIFAVPTLHADEAVPLQVRPNGEDVMLSVQYGGFNRKTSQVWYSFYAGGDVTSDPLKQHELFDDAYHAIPTALGTKYVGNGGIFVPINKKDDEGKETKDIDFWCSVANVDTEKSKMKNIVMRLDITKTKAEVHFKVDVDDDQLKLIEPHVLKLVEACGLKPGEGKWKIDGKKKSAVLIY